MLLGDNGTGKTTLLQAIVGMEPLSTGKHIDLLPRFQPESLFERHFRDMSDRINSAEVIYKKNAVKKSYSVGNLDNSRIASSRCKMKRDNFSGFFLFDIRCWEKNVWRSIQSRRR